MPISYLFDWGIPRHSVVHIEIAYIRISCYSVIDKVLHWVGLDSKTSGPVYFVVVLSVPVSNRKGGGHYETKAPEFLIKSLYHTAISKVKRERE